MGDSYGVINAVVDEIITPIIGLLFVLATIFFFTGVTNFFFAGDNEEKRSHGKWYLLWGLRGLAIMVGAVGILRLLCMIMGC